MATMMSGVLFYFPSSLKKIHSFQIAGPFLDLLAIFAFFEILVTNSISFFGLMATMMSRVIFYFLFSLKKINSFRIHRPFIEVLAVTAFMEIPVQNSISFFD